MATKKVKLDAYNKEYYKAMGTYGKQNLSFPEFRHSVAAHMIGYEAGRSGKNYKKFSTEMRKNWNTELGHGREKYVEKMIGVMRSGYGSGQVNRLKSKKVKNSK